MAASAPFSPPQANGIARFDLAREIAGAEARKPWASGVHSKTLVKQADIRVVLVMMESGARMDEHHADGSVSIQVMRGAIRLRAGSAAEELRKDQILTIPPSVPHDVQAIEPSVFLLTLSWPESEKLKKMPHRGYGS
jgi:quercetin dioxygenase-like cupin family protein